MSNGICLWDELPAEPVGGGGGPHPGRERDAPPVLASAGQDDAALHGTQERIAVLQSKGPSPLRILNYSVSSPAVKDADPILRRRPGL